ncbi:MAG TPA: SusD/RagB family nutrient-binding outer membrane lipoprotein [Chitinophagaceae bacterium]|nr:SusD/RagB family nutrient-binding outer membrane lipoprotein [Chitinophagaceae bacterium]
MNLNIKTLLTCCVIICLLGTSCKKYLDINNNPNGPEKVDPAIYLATIQTQFVQGQQFDGRFLGPYVQTFHNASSTFAWDLHSYNASSDNGGSMWRNFYWKGGYNMLDMQNQAREEKKWDILAAGMALEAWGWQMLTDYHGEIILREAFTATQNTFPYTSQPEVYAYVDSLAHAALVEIDKNEDAIGSTTFKRFDIMYGGDRAKWKRFIYGVLALNYSHLSNKLSIYKADSVIKFIDNSFTGNGDDALVRNDATNSANSNLYGPINASNLSLSSYGQSDYIVKLLDSTHFKIKDPRRLIMLTPSTDGVYRGLRPGVGQTIPSTSTPGTTHVRNMYGYTLGYVPPAGTPGHYLFADKVATPMMTYSMLQFIKAEAAFIKGDKTMALDAYKKGLNAHLDFVFARVLPTDPAANYATERTAYLANPAVVPLLAADLTLNQILMQKYIAMWGWNFLETWNDLRKYDYSNTVFTGFTLPAVTLLPTDNNGKYAYRVRPRYNSEYIWNIDALTLIGGFDRDYHTKKMWFHQP